MITSVAFLCLSIQARALCGRIERVEGIVKVKSGNVLRQVTPKDVGQAIYFGDYIKVLDGGMLHVGIKKREPRVFQDSPQWQRVSPTQDALQRKVTEAKRAILGTYGTKGESSAVLAKMAYGLTVYLADAKSPVHATLAQYNNVIWEGDLKGDKFGYFSNSAIGPALFQVNRASDLILTIGTSAFKFKLMSARQEAQLLNELEKANSLGDQDERAWARTDAFERSGLPAMAQRERAKAGIPEP